MLLDVMKQGLVGKKFNTLIKIHRADFFPAELFMGPYAWRTLKRALYLNLESFDLVIPRISQNILWGIMERGLKQVFFRYRENSNLVRTSYQNGLSIIKKSM